MIPESVPSLCLDCTVLFIFCFRSDCQLSLLKDPDTKSSLPAVICTACLAEHWEKKPTGGKLGLLFLYLVPGSITHSVDFAVRAVRERSEEEKEEEKGGRRRGAKGRRCRGRRRASRTEASPTAGKRPPPAQSFSVTNWSGTVTLDYFTVQYSTVERRRTPTLY